MILGKDFLFVHLQKTGGSFVENYLLDNFKCESLWPKHRGVTTVIQEHHEKLRFGCIRNPLSWYVSWWSANCQAESTLFPNVFTEETKKDFKVFIHHLMSLDFSQQHDLDFEVISMADIGVYTYRYFKSFSLNNLPLCVARPDISFLMDKIIHQENLNEELAEVLELSKRQKKKLLKLNPYHVSEHKHYSEYYDEDTSTLVKEKDRIIFERYYPEELV